MVPKDTFWLNFTAMALGRIKTVLILLGILVFVSTQFCCREITNKWVSVADTAIHYVGMQTCRTCHEQVYQTFIKTGMGQSFGFATKHKSAGDFSNRHSPVYDSVLDYFYMPYWQGDSLYIMEYRLSGRDTVHKLVQKIDYIIGSGQHTNSHIYSINGYLYQAPITFYTQKQKWDLAPGFEKGANSRFRRKIQLECMTCHNGYPEYDFNSENKFISLKMGIDCERCHGPGSLHVKEKTAGKVVDTSKSPDYTIVNPRRLSVTLQNNLCERCHLQGISVLSENCSFLDFRPGMELGNVMNVFMPEYEGAQDKMIMASHVERMKKSLCYINSGKMSCITCHNPHVSVKETPRTLFTEACLQCHSANACKEMKEKRAQLKDDCIICHMPRNGSIDIPHVAVTDHFIRRRPFDDTFQGKITVFYGMKCINKSKPDAVTTARSYLEFYERYTPSKGLLDSAIQYLDRAKEKEAKMQNRDYIRVYFLLNDFQKVVALSSYLKPNEISDAWTAYRLGESYYVLTQYENALTWYKRSVDIWRYSLDFENKYATCLLTLNRTVEAVSVFTFVLQQNPRNISANTNMGFVYMQQGEYKLALQYMLAAQQYDPDYEQNLVNLAVLYHSDNRNDDARKCLEHLLIKHPGNERAKAMLQDLAK